jgi:hypothetical protein
VAADAWEERVEGWGFDDPAADAVDEGDIAGAPCFAEAGDPEEGIGAEFEGVSEDIVDAAEEDIDAAEPFEGFEEELAVADGEVGAFDERVAHEAGFVGVFEVGFGVGARGHEDDTRGAAAGGGEEAEGVAFSVEERAETLDAAGFEGFAEDLGDDGSVFEGVAAAAGGLGTVGEDEP